MTALMALTISVVVGSSLFNTENQLEVNEATFPAPLPANHTAAFNTGKTTAKQWPSSNLFVSICIEAEDIEKCVLRVKNPRGILTQENHYINQRH